ncbi:DUF4209 domain-containing protein [Rhizobium sp. C1]|uniref:DUF4209 domain-containing protein n=1 Tax=Rhizobium sp. C1 TaxID=1349799 RepID=UPI001E44DC2E|nr:DUF4209 domain-containing protein [Rhizobium sp. C1]MCD2180274.1 DUF4209 domain-containing protein [Rhizobium sp. C1]
MESNSDNKKNIDPASDESPQTSITLSMISELDFENVIAGAATADCREYRDLYWDASKTAEDDGRKEDAIVYAALSALCGFSFRPNDVNDPYGPLVQMDGRRSAIPEDFRREADVVAALAEAVTDSTLKARLCDVAWLINRRRADLGVAAISAYCQTVREIGTEAKKFGIEKPNAHYSVKARDLLKRALSLASMRSVGLGRPEEADARSLVGELFRGALGELDVHALTRLAKLALEYDVVPPLEIASTTEAWSQANDVGDDRSRLDFLRFLASAYHKGGSLTDHYRCRIQAVDLLVSMARQTQEASAMLAAELLSDAIGELHGVPNSKERRREIRHLLVDVQTNIADEMQGFSQEIDLKDIIADSEAEFEGLSLRDMLFKFACMAKSPSPELLRKQAIRSNADSPLSSIFSSSFHDRDGKVSYRSPGVDLTASPSDEALRASIAQSERLRRQIYAAGCIQTGRRIVNELHSLTDETFVALFKHSPFVPKDLIFTYSRGFRRFFQGDSISGIYILTPLLEASIRHVLKGRGIDVSTFDNATKTQQDLTISAMFDQLKPELVAVFGDAVVFDIQNVFLSQPGPTIRHEVAHGLMDDHGPFGADAAYGCWLIFRLCMFPLFPYREKFPENIWQ